MKHSSDIIIDPQANDSERLMLRELGATLAEGNVPEGAELLYNGRNRLWIVTLPDGSRVNIKQFRRGSWPKRLLYGRLRTNKATRSFDNAMRLRSMGFDSPRPLMVCINRAGGGWLLDSAFYICAQEDNIREIRCWEDWPDRDALVTALGKEMARLFRAGVLFRDFSPGNVLLRTDRPQGEYSFLYVDVNRTDFDVHSRRKLMSMFRRINIVESETERLAVALAREMGWNERDTRLRALGVLRRFLWKKDTVQKPVKNFFRVLAGKKPR